MQFYNITALNAHSVDESIVVRVSFAVSYCCCCSCMLCNTEHRSVQYLVPVRF